jgi:orotate phosphoribosyltransferase
MNCRTTAGDRVTLVKDTLTTGESLRKTLQRLADSGGGCVTDVIVSVDRMERGRGMLSARQEIEQAFGVKIHAIVSAEDILRAVEHGVVGGGEHLDALRSYLAENKGADDGR